MTAAPPVTLEYKGTALTGVMSAVLDRNANGNRWVIQGGGTHALERKSAFDLSADPDGTAWAIVAVTGVKDDVDDIIVPGAFRRTLAERQIKGVLGHDWNRPVARALESIELLPGDPRLPATLADGFTPWPREAGALLVKAAYILGTTDGRDAWEHAKAFDKEHAYSIGYKVTQGGAKMRGGVRHITDLDLYEFSPVLHGANRLATLQAVKSGHLAELETGDLNPGEEKVAYVRDSTYWGRPVGTLITPGMKPRGPKARSARRQGQRTPSTVGTATTRQGAQQQGVRGGMGSAGLGGLRRDTAANMRASRDGGAVAPRGGDAGAAFEAERQRRTTDPSLVAPARASAVAADIRGGATSTSALSRYTPAEIRAAANLFEAGRGKRDKSRVTGLRKYADIREAADAQGGTVAVDPATGRPRTGAGQSDGPDAATDDAALAAAEAAALDAGTLAPADRISATPTDDAALIAAEAEAMEPGLFEQPARVGTLRASRRATGDIDAALVNVTDLEDEENDDQVIASLLREGADPADVEESLADRDVDAERIAAFMDTYGQRYAAAQSGQRSTDDRTVDDPTLDAAMAEVEAYWDAIDEPLPADADGVLDSAEAAADRGDLPSAAALTESALRVESLAATDLAADADLAAARRAAAEFAADVTGIESPDGREILALMASDAEPLAVGRRMAQMGFSTAINNPPAIAEMRREMRRNPGNTGSLSTRINGWVQVRDDADARTALSSLDDVLGTAAADAIDVHRDEMDRRESPMWVALAAVSAAIDGDAPDRIERDLRANAETYGVSPRDLAAALSRLDRQADAQRRSSDEFPVPEGVLTEVRAGLRGRGAGTMDGAGERARDDDAGAGADPTDADGGGEDGPDRGDGGDALEEVPAGGDDDAGSGGVLPGDGDRGGDGDRAAGGSDRGAGATGRVDGGSGRPTEDGAVRGRGVGATGDGADRAGVRDDDAGERDGAADAGGRDDRGGDGGVRGGEAGAGEQSRGAGSDDAGLPAEGVTEADLPEADEARVDAIPDTGDRFEPAGMEDLAPAGKRAKLNANMAAIRTLRALQANDPQRPATPAEQAVLARWAGWGGLPEVFDDTRPEYGAEREELRGLLSDSERNAARKNTLNAHYTDARAVQAMWKAVQDLGVTDGRVLEPGSGSGNFIGFAPEGVSMVGVELDPTTAALSKYLYPDAQIRNESFARSKFPPGAFDAAVGNVPFGDFKLSDPQGNRGRHSIHNHFIIKSLQATRPGGIVAVLTSRYTMDSQSDKARREMAELGDLVGAVRLPTGSHQRASGTDVIEDIMIFRRRSEGDPPGDKSWLAAGRRSVNGFELPLNDYFDSRPERVLGKVTAEKGQYGTGSIIVTGDRDMNGLTEALDGIVTEARAKGLTATERQGPAPELIDVASTDRYEGNIAVDTSSGNPATYRFTQVNDGAVIDITDDVPGTQREEMAALLGMRATLGKLLDAESATAADTAEIGRLRAELNTRYGDYTAKYGPVTRYSYTKSGARKAPPVSHVFRRDPQAAIVRALESNFDPKGGEDGRGSVSRAGIFTRRSAAPREIATTADNPKDALTLSLETYGRIDMDEIAAMLGTDKRSARDQLGDLVFEAPRMTEAQIDAAVAVERARVLGIEYAPGAGGIGAEDLATQIRKAGSANAETAQAYLSGDVRRKLAAARVAAKADPRYEANVRALEAVVPADLGPNEIDGRLGAAWIGEDVARDFLRDLLEMGDDPYNQVKVARAGSIWTVEAPKYGNLSTDVWGTDRRSAGELVQALLQQRSIKVGSTDPVTGKNVPDPDATLAAQAKAEAISERFAEWLWEDPERARRLAWQYNAQFNGIALRSYDGAERSFPGMAAHFKPRAHQVAAVERIVNEPTAMLAHVVGAGKTAEMVMGAAELKRLGMARKPAVVIPNHMLEQFTREYLEVYPNAKVLAAGTDDLTGDKRKEFVARAATGDWDVVILTQKAFEAIPMSADSQEEYIERELADMRRGLLDAQAKIAQGDGDSATAKSVKAMEKALLKAEEAMRTKLEKQKDSPVTFEQTGIDYLFVDEAHQYSNLRTITNIPNAGATGSNMATDLHMKLEYLRATNDSGRVATFATGTPIRNTVTQAYIMQRYLRPDLLRDAGITSFDAWAATFGTTVEEMELKPEGAGGSGSPYRQNTRFSKFRNVPELLRMFHVFADVKMAEDLNLPTPNLVGGKSETVVVPGSDDLADFIADLGDRAEKVRSGGVDPADDNMLKISGDGRKAALSMALVGGEHQPGKIEAAADRISAIHARTKDKRYPVNPDQPDLGDDPTPGALQIVFLDLGTPKDKSKKKGERDAASLINDSDSDWNAYEELRNQLVERGMDRGSIRFMHEAKNDAEKAELFAQARSGKIAVLVGSTEKMGVGTNVQRRAVAMHHLDAPWRPSDVEQRDGRIMRQGNLNPDVEVIRYVTEGSFDGYMWQTLERKARFINQIMRGSLDVREIEDVGDTSLSFAEIKALAAGSPDLLDLSKVDTLRNKLERLYRTHARTQTNNANLIGTMTAGADQNDANVAALDAAIAARTNTRGDAFGIQLNGAQGPVLRDRGEAGSLLARALGDLHYRGAARRLQGPQEVARIGGHTVMAEYVRGGSQGPVLRLYVEGVPGDIVNVNEADARRLNLTPRIENFLLGFEQRRQNEIDTAEYRRTEVERMRARVGIEFPKLRELEAARAKADRLRQKMARDALRDKHPRYRDPEVRKGMEPDLLAQLDYDPRIDSAEFDDPILGGDPSDQGPPELPPARAAGIDAATMRDARDRAGVAVAAGDRAALTAALRDMGVPDGDDPEMLADGLIGLPTLVQDQRLDSLARVNLAEGQEGTFRDLRRRPTPDQTERIDPAELAELENFDPAPRPTDEEIDAGRGEEISAEELSELDRIDLDQAAGGETAGGGSGDGGSTGGGGGGGGGGGEPEPAPMRPLPAMDGRDGLLSHRSVMGGRLIYDLRRLDDDQIAEVGRIAALRLEALDPQNTRTWAMRERLERAIRTVDVVAAERVATAERDIEIARLVAEMDTENPIRDMSLDELNAALDVQTERNRELIRNDRQGTDPAVGAGTARVRAMKDRKRELIEAATEETPDQGGTPDPTPAARPLAEMSVWEMEREQNALMGEMGRRMTAAGGLPAGRDVDGFLAEIAPEQHARMIELRDEITARTDPQPTGDAATDLANAMRAWKIQGRRAFVAYEPGDFAAVARDLKLYARQGGGDRDAELMGVAINMAALDTSRRPDRYDDMARADVARMGPERAEEFADKIDTAAGLLERLGVSGRASQNVRRGGGDRDFTVTGENEVGTQLLDRANALRRIAAEVRGDGDTEETGDGEAIEQVDTEGTGGGEPAPEPAGRRGGGGGGFVDPDEADEEAARQGMRDARGENESTYNADRANWQREARELPEQMDQAAADALQEERGWDAGQMISLNRARRELGMEPVGRESVLVRPASDGNGTVRDEIARARSGPARNALLATLEPADLDDILRAERRENQMRGRGTNAPRDRARRSAFEKRERIIRDVVAEQNRRDTQEIVRPPELVAEDERQAAGVAKALELIGQAREASTGGDHARAVELIEEAQRANPERASRMNDLRDLYAARRDAEIETEGEGDTDTPDELEQPDDAAPEPGDTEPPAGGEDAGGGPGDPDPTLPDDGPPVEDAEDTGDTGDGAEPAPFEEIEVGVAELTPGQIIDLGGGDRGTVDSVEIDGDRGDVYVETREGERVQYGEDDAVLVVGQADDAAPGDPADGEPADGEPVEDVEGAGDELGPDEAEIAREEMEEAQQVEADALGLVEAEDGEWEVTEDVAQRQERVEALLDSAAGGGLNIAELAEPELTTGRRDLEDELRLQEALRRRQLQRARDRKAERAAERETRPEPVEGGDGAEVEGEIGGGGGATERPERAAKPRQRPGLAGSVEDLADAIDSGDAGAITRAAVRARTSLNRSAGDTAEHAELREMLDALTAGRQVDAARLRVLAAALRESARTRRNEGARRRRLARRLERERLRGLIGQYDSELRNRGRNPDEFGGTLPAPGPTDAEIAAAEADDGPDGGDGGPGGGDGGPGPDGDTGPGPDGGDVGDPEPAPEPEPEDRRDIAAEEETPEPEPAPEPEEDDDGPTGYARVNALVDELAGSPWHLLMSDEGLYDGATGRDREHRAAAARAAFAPVLAEYGPIVRRRTNETLDVSASLADQIMGRGRHREAHPAGMTFSAMVPTAQRDRYRQDVRKASRDYLTALDAMRRGDAVRERRETGEEPAPVSVPALGQAQPGRVGPGGRLVALAERPKADAPAGTKRFADVAAVLAHLRSVDVGGPGGPGTGYMAENARGRLVANIGDGSPSYLSPGGGLLAYRDDDSSPKQWHIIHTATGLPITRIGSPVSIGAARGGSEPMGQDRGLTIDGPTARGILDGLERLTDARGAQVDWTADVETVDAQVRRWRDYEADGTYQAPAPGDAGRDPSREILNAAVLDAVRTDPEKWANSEAFRIATYPYTGTIGRARGRGRSLNPARGNGPALTGSMNSQLNDLERAQNGGRKRSGYDPRTAAERRQDVAHSRRLGVLALQANAGQPVEAARGLLAEAEVFDQEGRERDAIAYRRLADTIAELHSPEPSAADRLLAAGEGDHIVLTEGILAADDDAPQVFEVTGPRTPVLSRGDGDTVFRLPVRNAENGLADVLEIDTANATHIGEFAPAGQFSGGRARNRLLQRAVDNWAVVSAGEPVPATTAEARPRTRSSAGAFYREHGLTREPAEEAARGGDDAPEVTPEPEIVPDVAETRQVRAESRDILVSELRRGQRITVGSGAEEITGAVTVLFKPDSVAPLGQESVEDAMQVRVLTDDGRLLLVALPMDGAVSVQTVHDPDIAAKVAAAQAAPSLQFSASAYTFAEFPDGTVLRVQDSEGADVVGGVVERGPDTVPRIRTATGELLDTSTAIELSAQENGTQNYRARLVVGMEGFGVIEESTLEDHEAARGTTPRGSFRLGDRVAVTVMQRRPDQTQEQATFQRDAIVPGYVERVDSGTYSGRQEVWVRLGNGSLVRYLHEPGEKYGQVRKTGPATKDTKARAAAATAAEGDRTGAARRSAQNAVLSMIRGISDALVPEDGPASADLAASLRRRGDELRAINFDEPDWADKDTDKARIPATFDIMPILYGADMNRDDAYTKIDPSSITDAMRLHRDIALSIIEDAARSAEQFESVVPGSARAGARASLNSQHVKARLTESLNRASRAAVAATAAARAAAEAAEQVPDSEEVTERFDALSGRLADVARDYAREVGQAAETLLRNGRGKDRALEAVDDMRARLVLNKAVENAFADVLGAAGAARHDALVRVTRQAIRSDVRRRLAGYVGTGKPADADRLLGVTTSGKFGNAVAAASAGPLRGRLRQVVAAEQAERSDYTDAVHGLRAQLGDPTTFGQVQRTRYSVPGELAQLTGERELNLGAVTENVVDIAADGGPGNVALRNLGTVRVAGQRVADRVGEILEQRRVDSGLVEADRKLAEANAAVDANRDELVGRMVMAAREGESDANYDEGNARRMLHNVAILGGSVSDPLEKKIRRQGWFRDAVAEHKRLNDAVGEAAMARRELGFDKDAELSKARLAALSEVVPMGPSGDVQGPKLLFSTLTTANKAQMQAEWDAMLAYVPRAWLERTNGQEIILTQTDADGGQADRSRGYYSEFDPRGKTINFGESQRSPAWFGKTPYGTVLLHEMGHYFEKRIPELTRAEWAHHYDRTSAGPEVGEREQEKPAQMQGVGYTSDEVAIRDGFANDYVGKVYGEGGAGMPYELFTMSFESLFAGSRHLQGDADTEHWALGTLAMLGAGPTVPAGQAEDGEVERVA